MSDFQVPISIYLMIAPPIAVGLSMNSLWSTSLDIGSGGGTDSSFVAMGLLKGYWSRTTSQTVIIDLLALTLARHKV